MFHQYCRNHQSPKALLVASCVSLLELLEESLSTDNEKHFYAALSYSDLTILINLFCWRLFGSTTSQNFRQPT